MLLITSDPIQRNLIYVNSGFAAELFFTITSVFSLNLSLSSRLLSVKGAKSNICDDMEVHQCSQHR